MPSTRIGQQQQLIARSRWSVGIGDVELRKPGFEAYCVQPCNLLDFRHRIPMMPDHVFQPNTKFSITGCRTKLTIARMTQTSADDERD
jgi:hypothetical protein